MKIAASLAFALAFLSVPALAQYDLIAKVPRVASLEGAMALDPSWRTLRPLSMSAEPGARTFSVDRTATFNGKKITYRASVSETVVNQDGKPVVRLFNTDYVARNVVDPAQRPVIFFFNGGPGASSAPLHFSGAWGPRKLKSGLAKDSGDPANLIVDNSDSPLDAMDLVFLDPPDTGFSRSAPGQANLFRSVDTDSEAVSQFVVSWLKANDRLGSPVHLAGESYGSMRVIAMARDVLRINPAIKLAGVLIMGPCPTFGQNGRTPRPELVAARLPMMASVAYHYGKIDSKGQTWVQAVQKAREFGRREYLPALVAGHDITEAEFDRVVTALPELIGIPEGYFRENRTIAVEDFNRELLRSEGLILDKNNGLEATKNGKGIDIPAYSRKIEQYYARELKVSGLGEYWAKTPEVADAAPWNLITSGAPALDVTLVELLKANPGIRVKVMQGRHDVLTDLGSTEYFLAQTDIPRDRYSFSFYDGGHLVANTSESAKALRDFVADR